MEKEFDTQKAMQKFFAQETQDAEKTENTQKNKKGPGRPPGRPRYEDRIYRYNLCIDKGLDSFLHKIAWEERISMTQYINNLLWREREKYLAAGGSLEGWEKDEREARKQQQKERYTH